MRNSFDSQRGQVLLVVVLIMIIALTVGLALASRSIINLKNTNEEANSQKAFQAAEAGVELGLTKPLSTSDITIPQKTLSSGGVIMGTIQSVLIHPITGSAIILNNGDPVTQDEGLDVWLTNYPDYSGTPWNGTMYVYWGSKSGCNDAAIEAIVISGASASDPNAKVNRYGVDACGSPLDPSLNRIGSNHFAQASAGTTVLGKVFKFSTAITITNGLLVRLIPLYTSTPMAIVGYTSANPPALQNFPVQGRIITANGSYGTTTRQVSFFEGHPLLPSEFFYTLFQK